MKPAAFAFHGPSDRHPREDDTVPGEAAPAVTGYRREFPRLHFLR